MNTFDEYLEKINELKQNGLLTDAVRLYLAGMISGEVANSKIDPYKGQDLLEVMRFDWEKFGAVSEAAIFGDIIDYKDQRVDFTFAELMKR